MKKLITLIVIAATILCGAMVSSANYQDLPNKIDDIFRIWVGSSVSESDNTITPSLAERRTLPEAAGRIAGAKAGEYYSLDNSASGGFFYKNANLPQRLHLEFDYYGEDELFGDFRYSYLDYVLVRFLPRRFYHNLDNLTIYDFAENDDQVSEIEINDQGISDYGLRIDIDRFLLRLKAPTYPLHFYTEGEVVSQTGTKQSRFLGGDGYYSNLARVSESIKVDQESREFTYGTNSHLGYVEFDLSQTNRKFDSDIADSTYNYASSGISAHNVIPDLEATTNTFKLHTSHSGKVSASATLSEISKTNEDSRAEATNTLGYGEIFWLPKSYLSFTTKFRTQKNESTTPLSVTGTNWLGSLTDYAVEPGVESETNSAIFNARFSLIAKTNLNFQYGKKIKTVEDQSALDWSIPPKTTTDEYQLKLTNWLIPSLRTTAKYTYTKVGTDLFSDSINNVPDTSNAFNLGIAWTVTPRIVAFGSSYVALEETDTNSISEGFSDANVAEALRQQHLLSVSFMLNEQLSFTPTYTYISEEERRDIVWGDAIDSNYTNDLVAHNLALGMMYLPADSISMNLSLDYTETKGTYSPTSLFEYSTDVIDTKEIAKFSATRTTEIGVRYDVDVELGRGWGVGLDLRYSDWVDASYDNPSEGTYLGGLLKLTKVL